MRGFRRSPGAEHLVHAVELPELTRRRRPATGRRGGPEAQDAPSAGAPAAWPLGALRGPRASSPSVRRPSALGPSAKGTGAGSNGVGDLGAAHPALRDVLVPRPPALESKTGAATSGAPGEDGRIELLERRLAKLARLLEERDHQLQIRIERGSQPQGVASIYGEVQGLRGASEEAERKRSLMAAIFEANRKLRERVGSTVPGSE